MNHHARIRAELRALEIESRRTAAERGVVGWLCAGSALLLLAAVTALTFQ